jgi:hypothetical protein
MRSLLALLTLVAALASPAASANRYALVVASDRAPNQPDLKHAEGDAAEIAAALVELGRFEPSRIELVQGASRAEILAAAGRLAAKREEDRARFGDVPTLFAFFFSGHGESGHLLTRDGPVDKAELQALFERMDATLTLGVIDACYSGSLDLLDELQAKGVTPLPFNALEALPAEMLRAEGALWLVSSRPTEVSFEDRAFGGVFSHFFVEGMARAPSSGPGVTLDEIWTYAQRRTRAFTAERGRPQTPQKLVTKLRTEGPLVFSYPRDRTARLVLGPQLEGAFVLRYTGEVADVVDKRRGQTRSVAVLPGAFTLERRGALLDLDVDAGDEITVHDADAFRSVRGIGSADALVEKRGGMVVTRRAASPSLLVSAAGLGSLGPALSTTAPLSGAVSARQDFGPWLARLEARYGLYGERLSAWSYDARRAGLFASTGLGIDLGPGRLGAELGFGGAWQEVDYGDGARRAQLGPAGELTVGWLQPIFSRVFLDVRVGAGGELLPPAPERAESRLQPYGIFSLGLGAQIF